MTANKINAAIRDARDDQAVASISASRKFLAAATEARRPRDRDELLAYAQVYATLAVAYATVAPVGKR